MKKKFLILIIFILSISTVESSLKKTFENYYYKNKIANESDLKEVECETHDDCTQILEGSKCDVNNTCSCPESWILSNDKTKCLKLARGYGSDCEESIQCSETLFSGGVCIDNVCKCKNGYHYLKGSCWKSRKLHETCLTTEQCYSNSDYRGQECKNKYCVCQTGYYERFNSSCRKIRNADDSCNIDSDCFDGTVCEKMICKNNDINFAHKIFNENVNLIYLERFNETETNLTCPKGQFEMNGKCVVELGMKCIGDDDCIHIAKSVCLNNVCYCDPVLAIASENNRKCMQVARGKMVNITKSVCKVDRQCAVYGENSICIHRNCACKNETYWDSENQYCWKIKGIGETCLSDKDCHTTNTHAECKENATKQKVCTCQDGYYVKNQQCVPEAVNVGDFCEADENCLIENGHCDKSTNSCVCNEFYYPENKKCIAGVGSPCDGEEQCAKIQNTECLPGNSTRKYCLCKENHIGSNDYKNCLPVSGFGQECLATFQCIPKLGLLSDCFNGSCQCNETAHFYKDRCYRSRVIGESCKLKQECYLGNDTDTKICLNGFCSCHWDYTLDENKDCIKRNSASVIQNYLTWSSLTLVSIIVVLQG